MNMNMNMIYKKFYLIKFLIILLIGCQNKKIEDLMIFNTDDNSIEVGIFKSTIFTADNKEKVKRVGARGYRKMNGETDIIYIGILCGNGSGSYSELNVDRKYPEGFVGFDTETWDSTSGWVMDRLAQDVCKQAIKDEESNRLAGRKNE